MIRHERRNVLEGLRPFCHLGVEAREEGEAIRLIAHGIRGIEARQGFEDRAGDHLGVGGVEPVMGVAAPVRMAVASADPARTHVEEGHVRGRVDISGRSALHRGVARLTQQFVEPQVVVDADAQYCLRLAHAHEILRARLEALAILSCGDEVRCVDEIATDLGRERVQLRGRRDEVEARLREGGARE